MKPPPPPIVSIRYLAPGASALRFHLIPARAVMSTNCIEAGGAFASTMVGFSGAKHRVARRDDRSANFIMRECFEADVTLWSAATGRRFTKPTGKRTPNYLRGSAAAM